MKASTTKLKAAKELFGDQGGYLDTLLMQIEDEEQPLSTRAALAGTANELLALGIDKMNTDRQVGIQDKQIAIAERGMVIDENADKRESTALDKAIAEQESLTSFMARPALEQALRETIKAEQRGENPLIGSERLKTAFLKESDEQMQIVTAAMKGLPKAAPLEFRDIEFTRDGQPTKGTAVFDPRKGQFSLVPVADPAAEVAPVTGLPEPLAPYASAFEAAGAKYGIDPKLLAAISMHETGNGTSSAFLNKNNAMGISNESGVVAQESVESSIDKMARSLTRPGGYYDGKNTIAEIGKVYAPKGAGNDPRNLNQYWPDSVAKYYEQLGGNPAGPVRIQPGAARSTTVKTPTEQKLDEAKLAKIEAETAAAGSEKGIAATKINNTAKRVFSVIEKYRTSDGKPTPALRDAVGRGEGFGSGLSSWTGGIVGNDPETIANQQELELELLETDLLNAAKDLKPVSEDEMKMLLARRPAITSAPEVWVSFMNRAEKILQDGMIGGAKAPSVAPVDDEEDSANQLKRLGPPTR